MPYFDDQDLQSVKRVLDRGDLCYLGQDATAGKQFEQEFAKLIGVRRAVAVNSGMSALHCCVYAAGAGAGDEVICDPLVQFGAMAVMYNNAVPVFADVQRDTHTIDPQSVRERVTERTKAIICTHLWGLPADMDPIMRIAEEHGLAVIEDNAHALFATYKGRQTGTLGHLAEFSFQQSKQLSLGEGGMATTTDERFVQGLVDASGIRGLATFPRLMWNYRMNEVVSALGLVQMKRCRGYVDRMVQVAGIYNEAIAGVEWIRGQTVPPERTHTYHLWAATFEGDKVGISRERFERALAAKGARCSVGYIETAAYLHEVFTAPLTYGRGCPTACPLQARKMEYVAGLCPVAEEMMPRLMLIHTGGTLEEHRENACKLREVFDELS